jgi:large subunit ribosomal protein L25
MIAKKSLNALLRGSRLENAIVKLKINAAEKISEAHTLVKDIQLDPVEDTILHIDFNEISLTETIKIKVPLVAKGEAIGAKQDGGSLEHLLWELDIECLPTKIPKEIAVDVTNLKIGDGVHVKDIVPPEGIKILLDPDILIFSVAAPIKEEVPVAGIEGEAPSLEPEVIKKKKEVAEGEEETPIEEKKPKEEKK